MMKKYLFIGLLGYLFIGLFPPKADASMQNNNYNLENKSIEIQSYFIPTPKPAEEEPKEKPLASGKNYQAQSNSPSAFSFSTSEDSLNFGELSATNPVSRMLSLTIQSSAGYQIFSAENESLMQGKISLADTTCDNGLCTEITSTGWTSALTYGFGYHTQALPENEYMQFADLSKNESLWQMFAGKENKTEKEILYKINISGTQQPGAYTNTVTYLAVPSF